MVLFDVDTLVDENGASIVSATRGDDCMNGVLTVVIPFDRE